MGIILDGVSVTHKVLATGTAAFVMLLSWVFLGISIVTFYIQQRCSRLSMALLPIAF